MSKSSIFISDLKNLLTGYLSKTEVLTFFKDLLKSENKPELEIDQRIILDNSLTFTLQKLPQNKRLDFLISFVRFSRKRGKYQITKEVLLYVIRLCGNLKEYKLVKAEALTELSILYSNLADWKNSIQCLKRSQRLLSNTANNSKISINENLLATIYAEQGIFDKAITHFESAKNLTGSDKNNENAAMIDVNLGIIYSLTGKFDLSSNLLKSSLSKFENDKEKELIARTQHNLGMLHTHKEEYQKALRKFDKSILISEANRFTPLLSILYASKAFVYSEINQIENSINFTEKAFETANSINDILTIADIYKIRGMNFRKLKNYKLSKNQFQTSLRLNKDVECQLNSAETDHQFALLYIDLNNPEKAKQHLNRSLKFYLKSGMPYKAEKIRNIIDQI